MNRGETASCTLRMVYISFGMTQNTESFSYAEANSQYIFLNAVEPVESTLTVKLLRRYG